MKERKKRPTYLPTSLNLTAEIWEVFRRGFDLISLIFLYLLRYLFFKKSRREERSFLYLFGEDLSFSFGKTLLFVLLALSLIMNAMKIGVFFLFFVGSVILINIYLIFFRFSFYLRWMAFFIFLTFFFFEVFNFSFNQNKEASFESEY